MAGSVSPPNANVGLGGHDEAAGKGVSALLQDRIQDPDTVGRGFVMKPKKDHPGVVHSAAKNQRAEIFVVGYQNAIFVGPTRKDAYIIGLRHHLSDGDNIVTGLLQKGCDGNADRLVDKKSHGKGLAGCGNRKYILPRNDFSGIGDRRTDVLQLKPGVLAEYFRVGNPLGDHPHEQLDSDPGPTDNRLTHHDIRVHHNAI
jgi:hypothetical protein